MPFILQNSKSMPNVNIFDISENIPAVQNERNNKTQRN